MSNFTSRLEAFLHDPVDKCFEIKGHENRASEYAKLVGVENPKKIKAPDWIASIMERGILSEKENKKVMQGFTEIRHPLCEEKLEINLTEIEEDDEIYKIVKETFGKLGNEIKHKEDEYKFFYLWRNLLEELLEASKDKNWSKYLPLLPADTRIPDHSVWEHLKITSAINAEDFKGKTIQNNSLFLLTIGPVQSFITQARKTRDFYMGSFILSYFTFIGMKVIINKFGPTAIIYPDLFRQPLMDWFLEKEKNIKLSNSNIIHIDTPTIPNRFVAIIPETDKQEIKALADEIKKNINKEKEEVLNIILKKFGITDDAFIEEAFKQIMDFPQIYWVAIPWKKDNEDIKIKDLSDFFEENKIEAWEKFWEFVKERGEYNPNIGLLYQLLYTTLEKSIGARKNLRTFTQSQEEGGKCSICGERSVLFFCERENKDKFKTYNPIAEDLTEKIQPKYLADGEGLCSLCFLKRTFEFYLENKLSEVFKNLSYPSTAEVAIADFKEKSYKSEEFKRYENELRKILKNDNHIVSPLPKLKLQIPETIDGEFFFIENLNKKEIKEELKDGVNDEKIEELKELLNRLTEKYGKPNPYYALVYLDGDNMGKWLSGELLPKIEYSYNSEVWETKLDKNFKDELKRKLEFNGGRKLLTPAIHAAISTALRNYSIEFVRKIVEEEHLGKLIYAGGDDVLAFVNLKDLFDVMHKLRWSFSGHITIDKQGNIQVDFNNNKGFVLKNDQYILTMGPRATASMGVVIAHYKYPLRFVIENVFKLAKQAKEIDGKDGFAIALIKHSGSRKEFIARWKYENDKDTIMFLKYISNHVFNKERSRYIANSFIRKLDKSFRNLKVMYGDSKTTPGVLHKGVRAEIFDIEVLRLLKRSYVDKNKTKDKDQKFIDEVCKSMVEFFWSLKAGNANLNNFINALEIAIFVGGKEDEVD